MSRLEKVCCTVWLLALPLLVHGESSTVVWERLGTLPASEHGAFPGVAGPFVGVHQNALIIAGGANFPVVEALDLWQQQSRKTWHAQILVATRGAGHDANNDGSITAAERPLSWHTAMTALPGRRAYGATASHRLGVILMGGNDESRTYADTHLAIWDPQQQQLSLLQLPSLPTPSAHGGAAVIDDTLYVMAGSNGREATNNFYSFDLSRITTDASGKPLQQDGRAVISTRLDATGTSIDPWQQLPGLPEQRGENLSRTHMMVVAQKDGRANKLYIIGGRRQTTFAEHLDAAPVGLDEERSYGHVYSDVWVYDPAAASQFEAWSRKSDIGADGIIEQRSAGTAIAIGPSHILLLSGMNGSTLSRAFGELGVPWSAYPNHPGFERGVLAYNTITDAWTGYGDAPLIADPMGNADHLVAANAVTTPAVVWGDDIVLASGEVRPRVRSAIIWSARVQGPSVHFGWQNMTVLIIYLLAMVMVGVYFAFKNNTTEDYFRGGQHIPWWAAACSMYATMLSSLTYVALPALVYRTDWLVYIGTMMILIVAPIAIYVAMPFFRQIDATSAYEYLSKRFNMPVRWLASGLFTLFHIGRMGIVMALTALALAAVTPLDAWQCVLIMGVLCLIYCTLGGVEAVVWTDTIQTVVLLVGAVVCCAYIFDGIDGGFSGFLASGLAGDKFKMVNLDFGPGSMTSLSLWVIVLGGFGQNLSSYTADQAVVQRYMITRDTRAAARSIWANGLMAVPGALLFFCIGTGLYAFYQSQPGKLDPTIQIDQIFPAFIAAELPVGVAGLIVAGIFAAAQSTVSTSMNSLATTLVTDFMRPFNVCRSEPAYLHAARLLTFLMGVLGTLAGLLFISPEIRSLMEEYFKIIGMFMGALGGLFVLGVTTRRANGWGALVGIFAGVGVMISAWLLEWADGYLFATIGIFTCLLVGYLASLIVPSTTRNLQGLTLHTMPRIATS